MSGRAEKVLLPLITFSIVLLIWQGLIWGKVFPPHLLPSPKAVLEGTIEIITGGQLFEHIGVSLFRMLLGYGGAALLGVPLGLICGWYTRLWTALDPFVQVLRPVSPIAWMPLIVLWFSIETSPIFIIFLSAFFPILLSTVAAVRNVDPVYLKVARNFGTKEFDILRKIVIPASFPYITVGLHIALGSAWIHLVAGEMMGVRSGLGFLIVDARNTIRYELVITGIIFIGLFGLIIDKLITLGERWVNRRWGLNPQSR
jgi:NitT/TauT family transport system permease protein